MMAGSSNRKGMLYVRVGRRLYLNANWDPAVATNFVIWSLGCHCFTTMASPSLRPFQPALQVLPLINRRHVLALLAAVSAVPSRARADVAPQRSEIREGLAKRFTDEGTVGTFVGYKTDDYLVIASDKERSGEAMLPASTFKIPNSIIALETAVVAAPEGDECKRDAGVRSIEP